MDFVQHVDRVSTYVPPPRPLRRATVPRVGGGGRGHTRVTRVAACTGCTAGRAWTQQQYNAQNHNGPQRSAGRSERSAGRRSAPPIRLSFLVVNKNSCESISERARGLTPGPRAAAAHPTALYCICARGPPMRADDPTCRQCSMSLPSNRLVA